MKILKYNEKNFFNILKKHINKRDYDNTQVIDKQVKKILNEVKLNGDLAKGKASYAVCVSCHGANGEGNKALNAPTLAGQQDWYIARQLYNFKNGIRGSHPQDMYGQQMRPMAMSLSDEKAINNIATYISTLK